MPKKCSLKPLIDDNSKVLILGTLPGELSIKNNEYYANPRNEFWDIIFTCTNEYKVSDYNEKCLILFKHKIALWDVLKSAERDGSLDSNIKEESYNDIESLLKEYPGVELIIFNGSKAERYFDKYFKDINIDSKKVPSSSSMSGKNVKTLKEKIMDWKDALIVLDE